jgi:hypothetical protein
MLLAGCVTAGDSFAQKPAEPPRACEDLARTVSKPSFKDTDDPYVIAARYNQKLGLANGNLRATRKCMEDVRVGAAGNATARR